MCAKLDKKLYDFFYKYIACRSKMSVYPKNTEKLVISAGVRVNFMFSSLSLQENVNKNIHVYNIIPLLAM